MSCSVRDLTLDEALADPVIGAVLKADHVDTHHFETLLRSTARRLDRDRKLGGRLAAASTTRCRAPFDDNAAGRYGRSAAGDIAAW